MGVWYLTYWEGGSGIYGLMSVETVEWDFRNIWRNGGENKIGFWVSIVRAGKLSIFLDSCLRF